MRYSAPSLTLLKIEQIVSKQQSGTEPLNPNCSNAPCTNEGTGYFCFENNQTLGIDVRYFLAGKTCGEEPCTIKVDGVVLNCTVESECTADTCNQQAGVLFHCSGTVPNIEGCSGVEVVSVECTSETDSDICTNF